MINSESSSPSAGICERINSFVGSSVAVPLPGRAAALAPGAGLPARESEGVAGREPPRRDMLIFKLFFFLLASLISASLPAPVPETTEPFAGEVGRDALSRPLAVCFFLAFLTREVSLPLASERLGEPGRLSMPFLREVEIFVDGVPGVAGRAPTSEVV